MQVKLEKQLAAVTLKPDRKLDPAELRDAVQKADFKAGDIWIAATGELFVPENKKASDLALRIRQTGQVFRVQEADSLARQEKAGDLLQQLRQAFAQGKKHVKLSGLVVERKQGPLAIMVDAFEWVGKND